MKKRPQQLLIILNYITKRRVKTVSLQSDAIGTSNCIASNLEVNAIIFSPEMRQNYSTNYKKMASKTHLVRPIVQCSHNRPIIGLISIMQF